MPALFLRPEMKALLVEDDPALAELYRCALEQDGFDVVVAADGERGAKVAFDSGPDFVLLDYRLPKMNGLRVLEALKADPLTAHIPVIMMSADSQRSLATQSQALGALAFWSKAEISALSLAGGSAPCSVRQKFKGARLVEIRSEASKSRLIGNGPRRHLARGSGAVS